MKVRFDQTVKQAVRRGVRAAVAAVSVSLAALLPAKGDMYTPTTQAEFADAIAKAQDGDEIIISSFTCSAAASYTITNAVTIHGSSGKVSENVINLNKLQVKFDIDNADAVIRDIKFSNCGGWSCSGHGIVKIGANGGLVSNCHFQSYGYASGNGPFGVYLKGGRVTGCTLDGSGCGVKGVLGAVINGTGATVDHCVFRNYSPNNNNAKEGIVQLACGTLSDCMITNNTSNGPIVDICGDNTLVRNCTIRSNTAGTSYVATFAGGICWQHKTKARVVNNIVVNNKNKSGVVQDLYMTGSTTDAVIPDVFTNNASMSAILATNGVLVASIADLKLDDKHVPTRESPLVDAGTDAYGLSDTDLAGSVRVMGNAVDIGPFEYNPTECDFTINPTNTTLNVPVVLTATPYGISGTPTYEWTVSHDQDVMETVKSYDEVFNFAPTAVGTYSVKLDMTYAGNVLTKERKSCITAIEYSCDFTSDAVEGVVGKTINFTSSVAGISEGITYKWTFTNDLTGNSIVMTDQNPTYTMTEVGQISVTLEVTSKLGTVSTSKPSYIAVQVALCYVDSTNAASEYPYNTPAKAAVSLADALTACGDGGEIIIVNYSFSAAESISVTKGIDIHGQTSSANDTTINLNSKVVQFTLNHPNAVIRDVTIKSGANDASGHGVVQIGSKGGLVSNCVFSGNQSIAVKLLAGRVTGCSFTAGGGWKDNGCAVINGNSALFDHCIVSDYNHSAEWGSSLILLSAGTISDCLIKDNKHCKATVQIAGEKTVLRNCTIINNKKQNGYTQYGGIYWSQNVGSRIVNCVIAGNTYSGGACDIVKSGTATDSYLPQVFVNNCVLNTDIGTSCVTVTSIDDLKLDANNVPTRESPLVDAGTDAQGLSERDLAGMTRVMGNAVDIGPYEFNPVECDFVASTTNTYNGATVTLTAKPTAASGSQTYAWTVTHDEGIMETVTSTEEQFSFVASELGSYSVKLVMTDGGNDLVKERKAYIKASEYSCDFTVDAEKGLKDSVFHFTSIVSGVSSGLTYKWTFKNEQTGAIETSTEKDPSYVASTLGQITVTLEVTSSLGTISKKKDSVITVQPKVCYANPKSENAAFPYDTWATAASNVYDAVSTCGDGGEVVLASETFVLTNVVKLTKPITVRGEGAREDTILKIKPANTYAVSVQNDQATLKNVTITGATAGYQGRGGLNITAGVATNCVIRDNVASGTYAGPAAVVMTGGRLTGSLVCNNKGGHANPGVLSISGSATALAAGKGPRIDHCTIVSNSMSSSSASCEGMVSLDLGILENCLIAHNSCGAGKTSGVKINTYGTVYNCTITANKSSGASAGGLYWNNQTLARIANCVIVGNANSTEHDIAKASDAADSSLPNVFLNCVFAEADTNVVKGTNCKVSSAADVFKGYAKGDYTLSSGSVARDMGITSWKAINNALTVTITADDVDYAGNPRIQGATVDAGAYEYDPNVLACSFTTIGKTEDFTGSTFCLTGLVSGVTGTADYDWTLKNGENVKTLTGIAPSVTLTEAGYYDVELVVTVGKGTAEERSVSSAIANYLHAVPREFTVSKDGLTLAQAVEQAIDGCTIHVSGANEVTGRVSVNKAITIAGNGGAEKVSLNGQLFTDANWKTYGKHPILMLNNPNAVVRGLTISKGGNSEQGAAGGGVYIMAKGGVVEDCIVEQCKSGLYASGVGIYVAQGANSAVIRRTIVRDNWSNGGANGVGVYLGAGLLENCLISGNSGGNYGVGAAIGSDDAHIRNCTFVGHPVAPLGFNKTSCQNGSPEVVNTVIANNSYVDEQTNRVYVTWAYGGNQLVETPSDAVKTNIAHAISYCAFDNGSKVWPELGMTNMLVIPATNMGFKVDKKTGAILPEYKLDQNSALRDVGLNQDWMLEEGVTDLYGLPRIDKTQVDIGCSEAKLKFGTVFTIK